MLAVARASETGAREPLVRYYGAALRMAVERFLDDLGERFLDLTGARPDAIIDALARDHLRPPQSHNVRKVPARRASAG